MARFSANTSRRPTGDTAYNARRRYYRSAERYMKQAEATTGATAARYRELARQDLDYALRTYDKSTKQDFAKPIKKLAGDLGIDLGEERRKIQERSDEYQQKLREKAIDVSKSSRSARALVTQRAEIESAQLREDEARAVLNSPIGQRIIGGTVEIWQEAATVQVNETETKIDKAKILPELFKYFKVDSLAGLLEKVEEIVGDTLYKNPGQDALYEAAKIMLQTHIASNNTVTQ